jgi:spore maturation protein CgeB
VTGMHKLLIVGNRGGTNIGESFEKAASYMGIETRVMESRHARRGPRWWRILHWAFRGGRPNAIRQFSEDVTAACREFRPNVLLAMGIAPLNSDELQRIGDLGTVRAIYLTDDPWNPSHRAKWFAQGLPAYDHVFSPRRANIGQLRSAGAARVHYLPFGYDPRHFFPVDLSADDAEQFDSDVFFAGGADTERAACIGSLRRAGFRVALYGNYWTRFAATRPITRGQADAPVLRKAIRGARVSLCLVRHANRDGHSMRTYELPAARACVIAERTDEHHAIYGEEGRNVLYFGDEGEMIGKISYLLRNPAKRSAYAEAVHRQITGERNTYADRLVQMLQAIQC